MMIRRHPQAAVRAVGAALTLAVLLTGCAVRTGPDGPGDRPAVAPETGRAVKKPGPIGGPTAAPDRAAIRPDPNWSLVRAVPPGATSPTISPAANPAWPGPGSSLVFAALKKRLVASGFKKNRIDRLFASPRVKYLPRTVLIRLRVRETKALYRGFATAGVARRTHAWLVRHRKLLLKNQKLYGVPPEIIAALFMIETHLGGNQGRFQVFNVLATLAATRGPRAAKDVRQRLDQKSRRKRTRQYIVAWLDRKSQWAFRELSALIRYTEKNRLDIHRLKGSFAGALGICQFLPSNALTLGVDGNKDGRVMLHHLDDAVL
ncbi:MAG: lytic murein transglycosylase, partial [Proteobacteria bacterium]|nr:lytic murein transglycosylase [Pseudomonadota bacterium]MBU1743116.1 lytic murein transglycosylase [Pseudomonadota bacterium]